MQSLECRFYSLAEIREITGKNRSRDIKHRLTLWRYKYKWIDRQGVDIIQCPETPMAKFAELMHRYLHIDTQIDPHNFACFLFLLLEDEEFSSMPWDERSRRMLEIYGVDVSERTLRNWTSYLFKGEYLTKDKDVRTVWYSEYQKNRKAQVQVKKPYEDATYLNYRKERKEIIQDLQESGDSFSAAYRKAVCQLWDKYHRVYYYCYELVCNAFYVGEIIEILRAALQESNL